MILLAYSPGPIMTVIAGLIVLWMCVVMPIGILGNLLGIWDRLPQRPPDSPLPGNQSAPTAAGPNKAAAPQKVGSGAAKAVGWAIAVAVLALAFYSCATPPRRMSPSERYYWEHGEGRAIRDEQEYYQDRTPMGR